MKKIIGFALFFIAVGMLIVLLLPYEFVCILIMLLFLCLSYYLFCS